MVSFPSPLAHSFDTEIPIVAYHSLSDPPELLFSSNFLRCCRYIAVAHFYTCGEKMLGMLDILRQLRWSLQTRPYATECGQWTFWLVGLVYRLAVA